MYDDTYIFEFLNPTTHVFGYIRIHRKTCLVEMFINDVV